MDPTLLIAVGVLHLVAAVDIWYSQLTPTAKTLWTLSLVFLPVIGIVAWLLTRSSAHQDVDEGALAS